MRYRRSFRTAAAMVFIAMIGAPAVSAASAAESSLVAGDDFYTVAAGGELRVRGEGLLANDHSESGTIVSLLVDGPYHGGVSWDLSMQHGEFDYTPVPGFVGFDSFTYCLVPVQPHPCDSNRATVIIKVGESTVTRVAGVDRYEGAAKVAYETNFARSPTVFLASGENFPDALSAAPIAAQAGSALLLVRASGLPGATEAELVRLRPTTIVVVGGVMTVPQNVVDDVKRVLGQAVTVHRIDGVDRYAVSRALAALSSPTKHAFAAAGANFPDALAAGAVAGGLGEPVVLVNGAAATVDAATQAAFLTRGTSGITVAGGENSVSKGVEATLKTIATVNRVAGIDRYAGAVELARAGVKSAPIAYIATGANYPDALVGGVWAAKTGSPMYLAPGDCVPTAVLADIARIGASEVRLLGGTASLSERVGRLEHC
jgi:putative cell wall-binding protein